MSRVIRESTWAIGFAAIAFLLTWVYFDFDWPADVAWTFYAPYSLYTVAPWPLASVLFLALVGVRIFAVLRRRHRSVGA